ncbi:MAG TPA: HAD hydrolase-like protein [Anaerohalosphaeraceae bacterium]|jgi:phosphoglycolate phosphatase-like HAD superfamily hydrolase|nr:HAD hydrolase-like protein [Anaerohalosphaeraceae bacterium]HRT88171.1 HAD hydrolase-like protein [Anaerohalosphaeraceae bacterium]
MMTATDPAKELKELQPTKEFFVGIDSDGCAFDSMGIKQRECFCPMLIGYFGLQPVAQAARECKDFADLFSKTRGANRHKTSVRILRDLLPTHPMVKQMGFNVPKYPHYFKWVDDPNSLLSNEGLKAAIEQATDEAARKELQQVLKWSLRVNEMVAEIIRDLPPFPYVRESLQKMQGRADVIVCSATPGEALQREWEEHDIAKYVRVIAGQEMGTKAQHLKYATEGRYKQDHVLMIGDAPGDYKAARSINALFYPINPGDEIRSWKRFHDEALDVFLSGNYAGDYEVRLIAEFDSYLPELPPWQSKAAAKA